MIIRKKMLGIVVLFTVLILFPFLIKKPFLLHIMIMIFLYTTMSGGWNIISGYCGQISLGHVVFFGIGAYTSSLLIKHFSLNPWLSMVGGIAICLILATLIGFPTFRLAGHYFVIATLAIVEIIRAIFVNWKWVGGATGIYVPILKQSLLNFEFHDSKIPYYFIGLIMVVLLILLNVFIEKTRFGYYFRAIKADLISARSIGIDTTKYKLIALYLSVIPAAIAGTFYAQYVLFIGPDTVFLFKNSVLMVLIVVLGGIGTVWGPLIGAALIVSLSEFTRNYLGGGAWDMLVYGLLIIIIAEFEPNGIVGIIKRYIRIRKG